MSHQLAEIVGNSGLLRACLKQARQMAATDQDILLLGETGTGKDLFARLIHLQSQRKSADFIVCDVCSLPARFVTELLFGAQGEIAAAGRAADKGLLVTAHDGTLFLDEIADCSLPTQSLLEQFLATRAQDDAPPAVRLIAASSQNLDVLARQGIFRSGLLNRLQPKSLTLPPLRERPEDIVPLCRQFLNGARRASGDEPKAVSAALLELLQSYAWPGNVRELANILEQAAMAAGSTRVLEPHHLPPYFSRRISVVARETEHQSAAVERERRYLRELMRDSGDNLKRAAQSAGLTPSQLYALLQKHRSFLSPLTAPSCN